MSASHTVRSNKSALHASTVRGVPSAIDVAQTDFLYRASGLALVGNMLGAALLALGMWSVLAASVVVSWVLCVFAVVLLRYGLSRFYFKVGRNAQRPKVWLRYFAFGTFLSGCIWGSAASAFFLTDSLPHHTLLVLMSLGMAVSGIASNAVSLFAYVSFLLPTVLPLVIAQSITSTPVSVIVGASAAVFALVMILLARTLNRTLLKSFQANQQQSELARELATTVQQLRDSNARLDTQLELREQAENRTRESTERFQDFAQSASDFFWSMDAELRFDYFSRRFSEVTGVSESRLLGITREQSGMPPGIDQMSWKAHLADLSAHRAFRYFTHSRTKSDGQTVHLSINGTPVFTAHGVFAGYRGTGSDVTERVEARLAVEHASAQAAAASAAKSRFLATISHEIRTPLNAIIGVSDVLGESTLSLEQKRLVTVFNHAGEHLLSLVNSMLDLARIEADELIIERDLFDLRQLLETISNMFSFTIAEKGLSLVLAVDESTPTMVYGDQQRIEGALVNLLSNAVKFTVRGDIRLSVSADAHSDDVLFTVSDTGMGVPDDRLADIFEDFIQADSSVTRAFGGTGLGLAICRRVIDKMGGQIWVDSVLGEGSKFHIRVPLPSANAEDLLRDPLGMPSDDKRDEDARSGDDSLHNRTNHPRILLVDDSEDNRLLVKIFLKASRIDIIEAVDGVEALDLFRSSRFDLVFMDIHMPRMDGMTSTRHMREWELQQGIGPTSIVALTADVLTLGEETTLQYGFTEYMSKPIRKEELLRALRRLLSDPLANS